MIKIRTDIYIKRNNVMAVSFKETKTKQVYFYAASRRLGDVGASGEQSLDDVTRCVCVSAAVSKDQTQTTLSGIKPRSGGGGGGGSQ